VVVGVGAARCLRAGSGCGSRRARARARRGSPEPTSLTVICMGERCIRGAQSTRSGPCGRDRGGAGVRQGRRSAAGVGGAGTRPLRGPRASSRAGQGAGCAAGGDKAGPQLRSRCCVCQRQGCSQWTARSGPGSRNAACGRQIFLGGCGRDQRSGGDASQAQRRGGPAPNGPFGCGELDAAARKLPRPGQSSRQAPPQPAPPRPQAPPAVEGVHVVGAEHDALDVGGAVAPLAAVVGAQRRAAGRLRGGAVGRWAGGWVGGWVDGCAGVRRSAAN
jgi:hypothetical protein